MENGCCSTKVAARYTEGVEDVVVWGSGSEIECLMAQGGEDGIDIFYESDERQLEERLSL